MSEYWWSWKTPPGPCFYITPVEDGMGGRAGFTGFPLSETPFSIFRISVLSAESQKEINLTLKHWGLHLFVKDVRCCLNDYANSSKPTCSWHQVPMHSLFLGGSSSETHDWIRPTLERLAHSKDLDTWQSHLLLNWTLTLQRSEKGTRKNNEWGLKRNLEKCKKDTSNKRVQTPLLLWD